MAAFVDNEEELTPEGAEFLVEAIDGMVGDWGKTNWMQATAELMALVCEDKYDEVDRRLAALDVHGPSIVVFGHLIATHPASHHLHEFEPLLKRAAEALDYEDAEQLRREFER